jgi:selenium-binding protein 1
VRLIHIGPDGIKVDPFFNIDLNKFPKGQRADMTC